MASFQRSRFREWYCDCVLQLYSQYTSREEGQFSTDEGLITVQDIPIILRPKSPSAAVVSSNGLSPPVGMMPFVEHSPTSQDNSLSCDLSAGLGVGPPAVPALPAGKPGTEDILIMGSLSEIGTHEVGKWGGGSSLDHSPNNAHHHQRSGEGLEFASEGSHTHIDKEWYCHDEMYMPPGNEDSSLQKPNSSQSSDSHATSSRRNRKSLETLTTVAREVSGVGISLWCHPLVGLVSVCISWETLLHRC